MDDKGYSTYQWKLVENNDNVSFGEPEITYKNNSNDNVIENITVKATINNKDNIFAIIDGTYEVTVTGTFNKQQEDQEDQEDLTFTCISGVFDKPILCTKNNTNNTIEIDLTLYTDNENNSNLSDIKKENYKLTWKASDFKVQQGVHGISNNYLYILESPKLLKNGVFINGKPIDGTYVKNSAIPVNKIENILTIDFHNIKINSDEGLDIFHKLADDNNIGVNITTNALDIPELTEVKLPENEDEQIIICKSKSKNNGITFKISDPDESQKHFGYIIHIGSDKSAGYNSVWINRNMLNVIFPGMPADIMSTTEKFEYKGGFKLNKLIYKEIDVVAPISINNVEFSVKDQEKLKTNDYAPTYKAVTINESADVDRHNNMLLKNIEFVKFGDKIIKLNYEPLSEAQNQSI